MPKRMFLFLLIFIVLLSISLNAHAQSSKSALDIMLVIDNSGSMFPGGLGYAECCSDPNFLRITGAEVFLASLGFNEANEDQYQLGIVSMGDTKDMLVSSLQPVKDLRNSLVQKITNPKPENETRFVEALKLAYKELQDPKNRKPGNNPAVVLLTDGVPMPGAGQSNADIDKLLEENKEIPVFMMLLEGQQNVNNPLYRNYIDYWKKAQTRYKSLIVYEIKGPEEIVQTYNNIISQLQVSVPIPPVTLEPGVPYTFFVNDLVQKIDITVIRAVGQAVGKLEIKDSQGRLVSYLAPNIEKGVAGFRGDNNQVEKISISTPRLSDELKNDYWTLISDTQVQVSLSRFGAYQFNFQDPPVSITKINNVYIANQSVNPKNDLVMRFQLKREDGSVYKDPQQLAGEIVFPDGTQDILRISPDLKPDANGFYQIPVNFSSLYPDILKTPGRFIITLKAGVADKQTSMQDRIPIAVTKLLLDGAVGPYLIFPEPIVNCVVGQAVPISVTVGDFNMVVPENARLRVFSADGADVTLNSIGNGKFDGDLSTLCQSSAAKMSCSQSTALTFTVRLAAQMLDGSKFNAVEKPLSVNVSAETCTPVPPTAPPPTPVPTPSPIPDTDKDNFNDLVDKCPTVAKWDDLNMFEGCPPPLWLLGILGLMAMGVLVFLVIYVWPTIKVRWITPPPKAFVMACMDGREILPVKSIYAIGINNRTNKVKIGGGKKSKVHIEIRELRDQPAIVYVVESRAGKVVLVDPKTGAVKGSFGEQTPSIISIPNTNITLRVGLDRSRMKC
ncbi:MAG: vWA domain-containing protein [Chloroflexota bacterium]